MTATELIEVAESSKENPAIAQMYTQLSIAQSLVTLTDQVADILQWLPETMPTTERMR